MNELEILRIVYSERKPSWGGKSGYSQQQLRIDLRSGRDNKIYDLSDSEISKLLNGKSGSGEAKFLRCISGHADGQHEVRKEVETSLGLPGLFQCTSREEVLELIGRDGGSAPYIPRIAFEPERAEVDFDLTDRERRAIAYLADQLVLSESPFLHWDVTFNSGASVVAQNLWTAPAIAAEYRYIAIVRPSDPALPFEAEIRALRDRLATPRRLVNSKRALADAMCEERMLLVLLSPFALDSDKESNSMRQLLREFTSRRSGWVGPRRILIVGHSEWAGRLLRAKQEAQGQSRNPHSDKLMQILQYQNEARFTEFRRQWARFARIRGRIRPEESGSRMRRAATYYASQTNDLWPIGIRLRALFASNEATASYFDPTQGFSRLAGPQFREFADVMSYHADVMDYIDYIRYDEFEREPGARKSSRRFYLLQYVSTTKHWLTEDALEALLPEIRGVQYKRALKTEKTKMLELYPIVEERNKEVDGKRRSRYFASMAIKAIVQDDWIKTNPFTRSVAHYRTAERLKDNENNKQALVWEFPYGPHWGRSRIFFLSETIRHLVRSAETYTGSADGKPDRDSAEFPEEADPENSGTDPRQVINYCYEVLYHRELNGATRGAAGRALAKRYGAYQLAVELLQLMSANYVIGIPHPQLKPERRAEFMRDCGFALLDIGDLPKAKECFASAESELEGAGGRIERVNAILDTALVDSASGNLLEAAASVQRAEKEVEQLRAIYVREEKLSAEYRQLRQLFRRLLTRQAHLAYLTGDNERALDLLDKIENESRWTRTRAGGPFSRSELVPSFERRLDTEQTHLLVAALQKSDTGESRNDEGSPSSIALNRCLEAMLLAHSEGLNHQAMGFRIALARCFRRRGMTGTAETMLDAVHRDLLRYGCSERTFLTFLNEAGRVLFERGDPIRAYATYLHPCIGRAKAHGFLRDATQAGVQALKCLREIRHRCEQTTRADALGGAAWRAALDEAKSNHRKLVASVEDVPQDELFGRDPLFAYAIVDAQKVIDDLIACEDIDRHISEVERGIIE